MTWKQSGRPSEQGHIAYLFEKREGGLSDKSVQIRTVNYRSRNPTADVALLLRALPKVPVLLLFWDEEETERFDARVKLLFDATIVEHLDIESMIFLSERLRQLLCGQED